MREAATGGEENVSDMLGPGRGGCALVHDKTRSLDCSVEFSQEASECEREPEGIIPNTPEPPVLEDRETLEPVELGHLTQESARDPRRA